MLPHSAHRERPISPKGNWQNRSDRNMKSKIQNPFFLMRPSHLLTLASPQWLFGKKFHSLNLPSRLIIMSGSPTPT